MENQMPVNQYERDPRLTRAISTGLFRIALENRGISSEKSGGGIRFERPRGGWGVFKGGMVSCNGSGANAACMNKEATKAFLRAKGLPLARSDLFAAAEGEDAVRYAGFLGYPVVLKAISGQGGAGVWPNIQNERDLRDLWAANVHEGQYMIEKHVEGGDFRFLVVSGEVVAVLERRPPSVQGDGLSTVDQLIAARNDLRAKSNNPVHKIIEEPAIDVALSRKGVDRSDVPEAGQTILLGFTANISSGGDGFDRTNEALADHKRLAIRAVAAIRGLKVGGVDILIKDFADPAIEGNCTILEINHNPMLSMHHFPWVGKPQDVCSKVLDAILAPKTTPVQST